MKILPLSLIALISLSTHAFDPDAPDIKYMNCEFHPKDRQLGFCYKNIADQGTKTFSNYEYIYRNGGLDVFTLDNFQMRRAGGVLFSKEGRYILHVYIYDSEITGAFYETENFLNSLANKLATFSEYDIKDLSDFEDNGDVVYEILCPDDEGRRCIKSFNILQPDSVDLKKKGRH